MENWVYVVRDFYGKKEIEMWAKSSIDAARIFLKRKDIKRFSMNDKCIRNWHCVVYKYNAKDNKKTRIAYSINYYG